jgi:hypothetical protein
MPKIAPPISQNKMMGDNMKAHMIADLESPANRFEAILLGDI